ncbi:UBP1-associated protein 2B-like [Iris pallida]|uniref:UBP1-associated protein 2B-like n=1 Tax=Iris pallida TaxID=29817 RepID=A0AAX6ECL6_IRIPA|nr:UBP1-associated protein 2B-like [Iris pallida]
MTRKERANKRNNKKHKLNNPKPQLQPKHKKPKLEKNNDDEDPILFGSDSDTPSPTRIHSLLEPYSKDQLISFLLDAAAQDASLRHRIRTAADADVSHRKIFVHGLGWDTTTADLLEAMSPFGPVDDCNVVLDRSTGRSKGFGFVLFKTRSAAAKALEEPQKRIKNRMASCQLASIGPGAAAAAAGPPVPAADERRIYVSNVHADASADKLRALFAKFGEIESGPMGFDMNTRKSRGFAIFVYKSQDGAKKALEEPYKMFEGHQLHCQLYTPSNKPKGLAAVAASAVPHQMQQQQAVGALLGSTPQPVLAAMAAAQNLALLGQNPAYSMLFAQNPLLAAAAMNQTAMMQGYAGGVGMGGVAGTGGSSVLGAYGQGTFAGLQGMQGFPGASTQGGHMSDGKFNGTFGGFPSSYVW